MPRNIVVNPSTEKMQAREVGGGKQAHSGTMLLRGKTQLPPSDSAPPQNVLGKRECEVVRLVVEGKSNKEIAQLLNISVATVATYRARSMSKLGIHSLAHLIRYAVQHNLVEF